MSERESKTVLNAGCGLMRCSLYCPGGSEALAFRSLAPAPGETPSADSGSIITLNHPVQEETGGNYQLF